MRTNIVEVEYEFSTIFGMIGENNSIITIEEFKKALKSDRIMEIIKMYGGIPVTRLPENLINKYFINQEDIIGKCTKIEQRGIYTYGTIRFNDISKVSSLSNYKIGVASIASCDQINSFTVCSDIRIICLYMKPYDPWKVEENNKPYVLMEVK